MDLVLLTAALRLDNLKYIGENIYNIFKNEKDIIPTWIICIDQYNYIGDIEYLKKYLCDFYNKTNITYGIYYQGKKNTKNYGGALFNEPLKDLKNNYFINSDPLVYILDDDNFLNKNIISYIKTNCIDSIYNVWWLNMLDEYGTQRFVREIDRLANIKGTGSNTGYAVIHPAASLDPSQLIIHLDFLIAVGGFSDAYTYDYDFMNNIFTKKDFDKNIAYTNTRFRDENFIINSYHNGLYNENIIDELLKFYEINMKSNKNEIPDDSYLRIHIKDKFICLPLDNKQLPVLLKYYNAYIKNKKLRTNESKG